MVKREVCRLPPKPLDRPSSVNYEQETKRKRIKLYENQEKRQEIQNVEEEGIDAQKIDRERNCRPPPKPPYILNINEEVIEIIENVVPKTRPPLKTPRIHSSVDRERIDQEKECLLNTVLNHRPPPKSSPKALGYSQTSWTKLNLKWEDNMLNISYISGWKNLLEKAQNKK